MVFRLFQGWALKRPRERLCEVPLCFEMGMVSCATHIYPRAVLWIAFVVCRRRFAPRHYLPARGIAQQSRARRVGGYPGEIGLG